MATNFKEMLPQARGAIVANQQANKSPDPLEQRELLRIRDAGLDVLKNFEPPNNDNYPTQGRIGSRNERRAKKGPDVDEVARKMLAAGKSPQEIGETTARLLSRTS